MKRHHVHLSPDVEIARRVGARRGPAVILTERAEQMHAAGHLFYKSENGVWLVDGVPAEFLSFPWLNVVTVRLAASQINSSSSRSPVYTPKRRRQPMTGPLPNDPR